MGRPNGLGLLQVRVPGHDEVHTRGGQLHETTGQLPQGLHQRPDLVPDPEPQVGGHLIVARATGVQLAGDRSRFLVQKPLHQRVDVLVGLASPGPGLQARLHGVQSPVEGVDLILRQHTGAPQRRGPGPAPTQILTPEAPIHVEAEVQGDHGRRHAALEAASPEGAGGFRGVVGQAHGSWRDGRVSMRPRSATGTDLRLPGPPPRATTRPPRLQPGDSRSGWPGGPRRRARADRRAG